MASSFFPDFGLMWYLEELKRDEFKKFKDLLRKEPLELGLKPLPWGEVKRATRENLAKLLTVNFEEEQAWNVTLSIFHKIGRKDLCEKAKKEITGHAKTYQAHIKEKFSNLWFQEARTRIHEYLDQENARKEQESLQRLFAPKRTGKWTRTVILLGPQGVGKTTYLVKLMLAWAEGNLFRERFSYVFYFCCQELKQLTKTSLAALISRDWSDSLAPLQEITSQPERLLFIIDSFEELKHDLNEPESDLCSDWTEKRPVQVVLSSLLRKKIFPESSLLIAAKPVYPRKLELSLDGPEIRELLGFSETDRKLYFYTIFRDRNRAMEAFRLVRENKQLFCMCQIPVLCWAVCTCLKQEMDKGRDLAPTCQHTTSIFTSFVFGLFTPKGAGCPDQQSQRLLKGLCFLAAEGMWTDTFVFSEEDLERNGLCDSDIPALLGLKVLQKCRAFEKSYAFIHMCIQEFCAAMFYLLSRHAQHPNPAVGSLEALLLTFLKRVNVYWIYLGCFLFGLLREEEQKKLDAFFGIHLAQEIQQKCHQFLQRIAENEHPWKQVDFLALCYCLYEMQNEDFVQWAMDFFQAVKLSIIDDADLVVSAYCLKHCSGLRTLWVSALHDFEEEDEEGSTAIHWNQVCSALITNENLREFRMSDSSLHGFTFVTLCDQLKHPRCRLQKLHLNNVSFPRGSRLFFEVLTHSPHLKCLNLSGTKLSRNAVKLLCEALNNPTCNIEELLLARCWLSVEDCSAFSQILRSSRKLLNLNVSRNYLVPGAPLLCKVLCKPDCALRVLDLGHCYLDQHCWTNLYEVLLCNKSLIHLDLTSNILKDKKLKLLCEALKEPGCHLRSLWILKCLITAAGCRELASVLPVNPNLRNLQLGYNDIEDTGVKLLCEGLTHPSCRLEILGLGECKLTSACCQDISSVLTSSKTLRILNLGGNALDLSGMVVLCEALRHPECTLQIDDFFFTELEQNQFFSFFYYSNEFITSVVV
uniref:NLR family pyrin domain containing 4 n=1 Tax=Sus scrofa TaxID=9823 RepID=A0A8D0XBA1_PIG